MEKQSFLSRNFFVVSFVNLFIFFGFQMIFPGLPQYIQKMGGGPEVIGLVMGIFTVSTLIARPAAGKLIDRLGIANATLFSGFDLGIGLGVIALGSIAALYGYRNMYWFTLLPVIFAVLFYLVFMRRR